MVGFQPAPYDQASPAGGGGNLTHERQRAILHLLAETGAVSVTQISERFDVSRATARRDAAVLADSGRAVRNHGGLRSGRCVTFEQHFKARLVYQSAAKLSIARATAQLLPHHGIIFVDAGTTCLEIGRLLLGRPQLRIVTNSVPLLALAAEGQATVLSIGGEVRRLSMAFTGGFAQPWLADLRFDATVVGAAALDAGWGAYTSDIHEAAVKTEALRRAALRILAADAEKWNRSTDIHFAPWNAISAFVTNQDLSREARASLAESHVRIHLG